MVAVGDQHHQRAGVLRLQSFWVLKACWKCIRTNNDPKIIDCDTLWVIGSSGRSPGRLMGTVLIFPWANMAHRRERPFRTARASFALRMSGFVCAALARLHRCSWWFPPRGSSPSVPLLLVLRFSLVKKSRPHHTGDQHAHTRALEDAEEARKKQNTTTSR